MLLKSRSQLGLRNDPYHHSSGAGCVLLKVSREGLFCSKIDPYRIISLGSNRNSYSSSCCAAKKSNVNCDVSELQCKQRRNGGGHFSQSNEMHGDQRSRARGASKRSNNNNNINHVFNPCVLRPRRQNDIDDAVPRAE